MPCNVMLPVTCSAMNKGKILRFRMERAAPILGAAIKVSLLTLAHDRKPADLVLVYSSLLST